MSNQIDSTARDHVFAKECLKPLGKHILYFCKLESENRTLNCKIRELLEHEGLFMDQWIVSFNFIKGVKLDEIW